MCTKKDAIPSHLKLSTQISALAFIEGTNVVTKYQVSFFNSSNPRFSFLIYNLSFTLSIFRINCLQMFFKISVLEIFPNFTGKNLCWSPFFIKSQIYNLWQNICGIFLFFGTISIYHQWNETRLLSTESECTSCLTSCRMT